MSRSGAVLGCVVSVMVLAGSAQAQERELGVLFLDSPPIRAGVEQELLNPAWAIVADLPPSEFPGAALIVASLPEAMFDAQASGEMAELEAPAGVILVGEVFLRDADSSWVYTGHIQVTTQGQGQEAALHAWAAHHQFSILDPSWPGGPWRVAAFGTAAAVQSAVAEIRPVVTDAEAVLVEVRTSGRARSVRSAGGHHEIPDDRNWLMASLKAGTTSLTRFKDDVVLLNGTFKPGPDGEPRAEFLTESAMLTAIANLRTQPYVNVVGPWIRAYRSRILSNRLIVTYHSPRARFTAESSILPFYELNYGLELVHQVPWLRETYIYALPTPNYLLYDAAHDLLAGGLASLALPDTYLPASDATGMDDCSIGPQGQDYLNALSVPEAWSIWRSSTRETRIAYVDRGLEADAADPTEKLYCDEMNVQVMLDLTKQYLTEFPRCDPPSNDDWCSACAEDFAESDQDTSHGERVSVIGSAVHSMPDGTTSPLPPCDAPRGTSDGSPAVLIRRVKETAEWILASALIWAAGGSPGHALFGEPLSADSAASVINLSFHLGYENPPICDSSPGFDCAAICDFSSTCNLLEPTLAHLRLGVEPVECLAPPCIPEGGALVLNARAHNGLESDLDGSSHTTTIGSVGDDGELTYSGGFLMHVPSDTGSGVAPLGYNTEAYLGSGWTNSGYSSAATGATSGIAAMMFDVNPTLTARQAHCLLEATAQKQTGTDQWWETALEATSYDRTGSRKECRSDPTCGEDVACTSDPDICSWQTNCGFHYGYSRCVGYGRIDAEAAVKKAKNCSKILDWDKVSDFEYSVVGLSCPCDPSGVWTEFVLTPIQVPLTQQIPEFLLGLLECLLTGDCDCGLGPDCLNLDVINQTEIDWHDVYLEAYLDEISWRLPPILGPWKSGQSIVVPFAPNRALLDRWRETGVAPRIRAFSGGKEIEYPPHSTRIQHGR